MRKWRVCISMLLALPFFGLMLHPDIYNEAQFNNMKKDYKQETEDLNNTRKSEIDVLFFNRVPKAGSETLLNILMRLSTQNDFHFGRDLDEWKTVKVRLSKYEQGRLIRNILKEKRPSMYGKHVGFVNFTRFHEPMPIYLNMVRDPIERIISWYYYIRAPWNFMRKYEASEDPAMLPNSEWLKKDFNICVQSGDPECIFEQGVTDHFHDHRRQTFFFCGHGIECWPFNSEIAMRAAKENVEKYYAVVGLLEDMNTTLAVMERYIPKFFKGATQMYYEHNSPLGLNQNTFKPFVSQKTRDMLKKNLTREIEFYEFCKQRLYRQYSVLK